MRHGSRVSMHESRRFDIVMHALRVRVEAARREPPVTRYEEPRDMIAAYFSVPTLCAIALVHVYWACGGRRGKRAAIPEHDGVPLLHPSTAGTCTIAAALLAAACVVAARAGWVWPGRYPGASGIAIVVLALLFAVRAVGDFRYVGFFKRIRGSRFARMDTLYYSPLCATLALSIASMAWRR
ncbi:conserved hypothetical protein [Burkholderia multivorans CGD1]|nr:conserved hypothetical protein [Burkholderia multivorans CGD1]